MCLSYVSRRENMSAKYRFNGNNEWGRQVPREFGRDVDFFLPVRPWRVSRAVMQPKLGIIQRHPWNLAVFFALPVHLR